MDHYLLPTGWKLTETPGSIELRGPYNEDLRGRLRRLGAWDADRRVWVVPICKRSNLRRVLYNASRAAPRPCSASQEVSERLRWLGYVQEHAQRGKLYERGIEMCRAHGIDSHPVLLARLQAAIELAHRVQAGRAAGPDRSR